VIYEEPLKRAGFKFETGDRTEAKESLMLKRSMREKLPTIVENVGNDLSAGTSVLVLCKRKNQTAVTKALKDMFKGKTYKARLKQLKAKSWAITGDVQDDARDAMCEAAKSHIKDVGPVCVMGTIDALQGAVSLLGITSVHVCEFDPAPGKMQQAIERPYEPEFGGTGLWVGFYVLKGSYDERLESIVRDKVESLLLESDEGAEMFLKAGLTAESGDGEMNSEKAWSEMLRLLEGA